VKTFLLFLTEIISTISAGARAFEVEGPDLKVGGQSFFYILALEKHAVNNEITSINNMHVLQPKSSTIKLLSTLPVPCMKFREGGHGFPTADAHASVKARQLFLFGSFEQAINNWEEVTESILEMDHSKEVRVYSIKCNRRFPVTGG